MKATRKRVGGGITRQRTFFPMPDDRSDDQIDNDVVQARHPGELPAEVGRTLAGAVDAVAGTNRPLTEWDSFKESHLGLGLPRAPLGDRRSRDENEFILTLVKRAVEEGFWCALQRYAKHLRGSREAMAFINARAAGAERGRKVQQTKKADRIGRIQSMLNSGMEPSAIAADLRCSISTVYRALAPVTSKPRKASKRSRKR